MSIKYISQKIKAISNIDDNAFIIGIIVLVALGSFGLGYLSNITSTHEPLRIESVALVLPALQQNTQQPTSSNISTNTPNTQQLGGTLVASKNSDKYHYPWCSGAKRIKKENKISFANAQEARDAGYMPAGNCKGLE